ncbi:hypothetical protein [Parendozoicomonas haliclonae]|uniref:thiopurine S-methyltransferase n=1 Tax=Parendozoicomonas haliclonae TaxID=1960125 RepID=A0A1X7ALS4_9GAMM|nr:hypothetical protein [Parendozoicomonas haliclonae]SMA48679.1 Thiopurine S-methyltransferase [Parendozoicomonas haliclonae]
MVRAFVAPSAMTENQDWEEAWEYGFFAWHRPSWNPSLLRFFPLLNHDAGTKVLVPLCGKSRDMEWLLRQGYQVVGLEISGAAIEDFFRERGLEYSKTIRSGVTVWLGDNIEIWEADLFALPDAMTDATAFYDCGAFIALPPAQHGAYVENLMRLAPQLQSGLVMGLEYDQSLVAGPPWSINPEYVREKWGSWFESAELERDWDSSESARMNDKGERYAHLTIRLDRR